MRRIVRAGCVAVRGVGMGRRAELLESNDSARRWRVGADGVNRKYAQDACAFATAVGERRQMDLRELFAS